MSSGSKALGIILPIALGALTGGIGAFTAGLIGAAAIKAVLVGAALGAISVALNAVIGSPDVPTPNASGQISDIQLNTFSRVSRVPVVYGFRRVGANIVHMDDPYLGDAYDGGKQDLFWDAILVVAEGPCRGALSLLLEDQPADAQSWRFLNGFPNDPTIDEFTDIPAGSRLPHYPNSAKIHFSGNLGFVRAIPNFATDLMGIYPSNTVEQPAQCCGTALAFSPVNVGWDGPTNSAYFLDDAGAIHVARMPLESVCMPTEYVDSDAPDEFTLPATRAWYIGIIDAVVFAKPDGTPSKRNKIFYVATRGDESSNRWTVLDYSDVINFTPTQFFLDDRSGRLHVLGKSGSSVRAVTISFVQGSVRDITFDLPDQFTDFTTMGPAMFRPEDNAYVILFRQPDSVSPGTPNPWVPFKYSLTLERWVPVWDGLGQYLTGVVPGKDDIGDMTQVELDSVHSVAKIGVWIYMFFAEWTIRLNTVKPESGIVWEYVSHADLVDEDDSQEPTLSMVKANYVASRYLCIALWDVDGEWLVTAFHGPREPIEEFSTSVTYDRFGFIPTNVAFDNEWHQTACPGTIIEHSYVTMAPATSEKTLQDVVDEFGAHYLTTDPDNPSQTTLLTNVIPGYVWTEFGKKRSFWRVVFVDPVPSGGFYNYWIVVNPKWDQDNGIIGALSALDRIVSPVSVGNELQFGFPFISTYSAYIAGPFQVPEAAQFPDVVGQIIKEQLNMTDDAATLEPPYFTFLMDQPVDVTTVESTRWVQGNFDPGYPVKEAVCLTPGAGNKAKAVEIAHSVGDDAITTDDVELLDIVDLYGFSDFDGGTIALIGEQVGVAQWRSTQIVNVTDVKPKQVALRFDASSWSHRWFQSIVTPGSVCVDMLLSERYGQGESPSRIDIHSYLSLHGYALEEVVVDGERIRRYLINMIVNQDTGIFDFFDEVLGSTNAFDASGADRFACAFESGNVEPIMEFDSSNIVADTFRVSQRSSRTHVNRVRCRFYNIAEHREDEITLDDEHDIQITGETREKEIILPGVTDRRRAAMIAYFVLHNPKDARLGCEFETSGVARFLDPGDVIAITAPTGAFIRKPFMVVEVADGGGSISIKAQEIAPAIADEEIDTGVDDEEEAAVQQVSATGAVGTYPSEESRDASAASFHGRPAPPLRSIGVYSSVDKQFVGLGNNPDGNAAVRFYDSDGIHFATKPLVESLSMAALEDITGTSPEIDVDGILGPEDADAGQSAWIVVKRSPGVYDAVEEIALTSLERN